MYAGGLAGMAGVPLALGSLWGLLVCVPMSALIVRRMLDEEKYLTANLAGYAEYRVKTRWRLIPGVY
jgi:protein-S-isoprenylcysteine O-methyltransferase Ste14